MINTFTFHSQNFSFQILQFLEAVYFIIQLMETWSCDAVQLMEYEWVGYTSHSDRYHSATGWLKKKASVVQSCPTLHDPMDYSPLGSCIHGILQTRRQEWVAIPFLQGIFLHNIEPWSPALQSNSLLSEPSRKPNCMDIQGLFLLLHPLS